MSVKPLSGSFVSLFSTTASGASGKAVAQNDTGSAVFKEAKGKSGHPTDKVDFSARALAVLKSGAATAVQAKAATPVAAGAASTTTASATPASASPATTQGAGATAVPVTAPAPSPATAVPLDGTDTPPLLLTIGGDGTMPAFDPHQNDKIMEYHAARMAHDRTRADLLRGAFGPLGGKDMDYGFMLSGNIADAIDKTMVLDGAVLPEKPAALLEKEKAAREANPQTAPEGTANTSMIVFYLPNGQSDGHDQIEIMFDDKAMAKLAGMSPDAVKAGMVDMLGNTDEAAAGNAAMKSGMMGKMMAENAGWHPEFANSKARYGVFDPAQGTNAQPMMMIQSESRPDYVKQHVGDLVDAVMGLLRGAAPTATAPTASTPAAGA